MSGKSSDTWRKVSFEDAYHLNIISSYLNVDVSTLRSVMPNVKLNYFLRWSYPNNKPQNRRRPKKGNRD
jgi:hypothetical protein